MGLFAGLRIDWPPAWRRILEPVDGAVREYGLTNDLFASRSQLETAFRDAGLTIERAEELTDRFDYHTADIALTCWRQIRFVPLMLRGLSPQVVAAVEEAFEARVREAWSRTPPEDLVLAFGAVSMVGYR